MNAETKNDPFEQLLARRVKTIRVEGWPEFELREAPMGEVEPLIFHASDIEPQELLFQLIGKSIWIGEHRGSPELLKRMGPTALARLLDAVQAEIFDLYGIKVDPGAAAEGNEAKPPGRSKKKG